MAQQELSTTQRRHLKAFQRSLSLFQALRQDIPASVIEAFITVARDPGKTMVEYGKALGTGPSTMSRQLRDLTDKDRFGNPGYQLLEVQGNAVDTRQKNYLLTQRGLRLVTALATALSVD
jgi:DNA-binding MarR family transcriptional regulator